MDRVSGSRNGLDRFTGLYKALNRFVFHFSHFFLSLTHRPSLLLTLTQYAGKRKETTGTTSGAVVGRSAAAPEFFFENFLHQKFRLFFLSMNPVLIF
jgi:hypothetical protein